MQIEFSKYHGAGNDFIVIDNRDKLYSISENQINDICQRRYGIGADGLMILEKSNKYDFHMKYYNSDGKEGSMCGNGGRCIVAFAKDLGIINNETIFDAVDGVHKASINKSSHNSYDISLEMNNVDEITQDSESYFLDTGSPHHIEFVDNIEDIDVFRKGKEIRYSNKYKHINGTNVNFIKVNNDSLSIRTYERGVEDETHACGTGATAAAIAYAFKNKIYNKEISLHAVGGILRLKFDHIDNTFTNIILSGPTKFVYKGTISV